MIRIFKKILHRNKDLTVNIKQIATILINNNLIMPCHKNQSIERKYFLV